MARPIKFIPPLQVSVATSPPVTVTGMVTPVKNPVIANLATDPVPGNETSFTLLLVKRFHLINRGSVKVQACFIAGQSATVYRTIYPNSPWSEDAIDAQNLTFYVQAPAASQRLELISWY